MTGLLRHLQREKQRGDADERRAVIRSGDSHPDPLDGSSVDDPSFTGFLQPTMTISDVSMAKSATPAARASSRADAADKEPEKTGPVWLTEQKRSTPQVEMLIASAGRLIDRDAVVSLGREGFRELVRTAVATATESLKEEVRITPRMRDQAEGELLKILSGRGPLDDFFKDAGVTDIFVDSHRSIKVLREGEALETAYRFRTVEEYRLFVLAMLSSAGRSLGASDPVIECVLDDQFRTRVSVLHESVVDGCEPRLALKIPRLQRVSFFDVLQAKTLPATVAAWLSELVACRDATILVVGPHGSGKTVMMTALMSAIPSNERVIAIERIPEISVTSSQFERLVPPPPRPGGDAMSVRSLVDTALRRSPHRVVLGDVRTGDASAFIGAVEGGLSGSFASIVGHSAEDALYRLYDLASAEERGTAESVMRRIARSIQIVITMWRIDDRPCLVDLAEVRSCHNGRFVTVPLVRYAGLNQGRRQWQLQQRTSPWLDALRSRGVVLKPGPALLPVPESPSSTGPEAA